MRPEDLQYSRSHEWVRREQDEAVLGITDFAVSELSDLVFVDLPEPGDNVEKDTPFGEIESVKTVSDLVSAISGEVIAVNDAVADNPNIIADDPYDEGWLIRVRFSDPAELEDMMSAADYEAFVESQESEREAEEGR